MNDGYIQSEPVKTGNQNRIFIYVTAGVLLLAGIAWGARLLLNHRQIDAHLLKQEIFLNEPLVYTDNTPSASRWVWEFGNGDQSMMQSGTYRFPRSGVYIVRVTVDGELREQFPVTVKDTVAVVLDTVIHILGPGAAAVGEQVRLEADGNAGVYEWSFGETGRVDAKGRTVFYNYHLPGQYKVELQTDKSATPVYHLITVTEPYKDAGDIVAPGDAEMKITNDFRAHLQAIASGGDFNRNYYYLVHCYLCNGEKTTVQASDETGRKMTDFYSYCIGLTFSKNIVLDQVSLTLVPHTQCVNLVTVQQHRTSQR